MLRIPSKPSPILMLALLPATLAATQSPAPAAPTQTSVPAASDPAKPSLYTYTAPDRSASASLPTGWTVTRGGETVIVMTSPNNETIILGDTFIVKSAPNIPKQSPADGIDLSIPNSASSAEKFAAIVDTAQFVAKASPPKIKIASSTPFKAAVGVTCASLDGSITDDKGNFIFRAVVCSLPVDVGGTYKVIVELWQAPPAIAAREKSLAQMVLASYRVPPPWLQKKLAPHTAPPVLPMPSISPLPSDRETECFDLAVLRQVPESKLPDYCRTGAQTGPQ